MSRQVWIAWNPVGIDRRSTVLAQTVATPRIPLVDERKHRMFASAHQFGFAPSVEVGRRSRENVAHRDMKVEWYSAGGPKIPIATKPLRSHNEILIRTHVGVSDKRSNRKIPGMLPEVSANLVWIERRSDLMFVHGRFLILYWRPGKKRSNASRITW